MKPLMLIAAGAVLLAPMSVGIEHAGAATAHNSQAGGFGASANAGDTTVNSRRVKHAAKHRAGAAAAEPDRDAGMYIVKPQADPEYFGHGSGSDGSMPPP